MALAARIFQVAFVGVKNIPSRKSDTCTVSGDTSMNIILYPKHLLEFEIKLL